jgi:hypothetical protein
MCTSPWIAYDRPRGHGPSQVSKAVCVGITASDVGVRSFSVAVWSNLLTQIVRLEPLFDLRQNKRTAQLSLYLLE